LWNWLQNAASVQVSDIPSCSVCHSWGVNSNGKLRLLTLVSYFLNMGFRGCLLFFVESTPYLFNYDLTN
jgi:hypothetical protein